MRLITILALMFITMFGFTSKVEAASVSWDGGGGTTAWNTGTNWSNDTVPTDADDITIDNAAVTATTTAINFSTLTIGSGVNTSSLTLTTNIGTGGSITINNAGTLTQNNKVQQTISGTLLINSGGNLTHTANTTANTYNVNFSAATIDLEGTGTINVDGKGYAGAWSAGSGTGGTVHGTGCNSSGGAGYGGKGGNGANGCTSSTAPGGITYGSLTSPDDLGSSSGASDNSAGTSGGGLVKLNVTGTLTVAGSITANGSNGGTNAGGGSGGGINITAGTFTGSGSITVNGGNGHDPNYGGGTGGGGRISIIYTTDSSSLTTLSAYGGGTGIVKGGAGTIYKATQAGASRTLTVDNNSNTNAGTPIPSSTTWTIDTLNINNAGDLQVPSGTTFTLTGTISTSGSNNYFRINTGTATWPTTFSLSSTLILDVDSGSTFNSSSIALTIANGGTLQLNDTTQLTFSSITVQSGGTINHTANTTSKLYNVNLVTTTLNINDGGSINTNGKGYSSGNGQGTTSRTTYNATGGAAYGGAGGQGYNGGAGSGGISNGSLTTPNDLGSASGASDNSSGANGGGLVQLSVTGTLTVNGSITANGSNGGTNAGGGSGGGINITAGTFTGSGSITSNGGTGGVGFSGGGGGGGGRIAISATTNTYTGSFTSTGGAGGATGGGSTAGLDGTIYFGTPTFDNVTVTANTNYNSTITGVKTISFWVKPTTTSPGLIQLSNGVEISASSNTISTTGITSPTVYVNGSVSSTLTQNSWNHVTVTTSTAITADSLTLGKMSSAYLTGQIDDVRLLSTALTAAQVTTLYNYTVVLSNITTGTPASEEKSVGPVAYYQFDDGTGTTTKDSTSNKNTGTLGGTTIPTWQTEDACISGKCLFFDGTTSKVTGSKIALNIQTVAFWIKPNTIATQGLLNLDGGTHKISTNSSGVLSATGFTSPTYYINGVLKTTPTLTLNQWNYVEITTGTGFDSTNSFTIGTDGTNFIKGYIDEVKFYGYARTQAQINADYNARGTTQSSASFGDNRQRSSALSNGLVGYWKMDEASANTCTGGVNDSCDSSGNSNNGAWGGDATSAAGKFGNGVTFDGTGDYINLYSSSLVNTFSPTEGTISLWTKVANSSVWSDGAHRRIIYLGVNGPNSVLIAKTATSGQLTFAYSAGGTIKQITKSVSDTDWIHLVISWSKSNDQVKAYYNGTQQSSTLTGLGTWSGSLSSLLNNIGIESNSALTNPWNGSVDEVRLYNRALSPAEVAQLYNFAPGPVLHLNMDQKVKGDSKTLTDSSGFGNNGTTVDGANNTGMDCSNKPGKYGGACDFDGVDDSASVSLSTPSYITLEGWIYENGSSITGNTGFIGRAAGYNCGGNLCGTRMGIYHEGSTVQLGLVITGDNRLQVSNAYATQGWHHVAGTYDGNTMKLYVDGVLKGSSSVSGTIASYQDYGNGTWYIGSGESSSGYLFNGQIDEVKIYNYARSAKQISEDMLGSGSVIASAARQSSSGAVAYYSFDEGYSTSANDQSINKNTLTLSSASWTNSGKFNKAWNGTGAIWVSKADDSDFDFSATEDFATSLWFKSDSATNPSAVEYLLNKASAVIQGYSIYANTSGYLCFGIDDDTTWGPNVASCTTSDFYDNSWHHLVGIRNTTLDKTYIYIDGVLRDSDTDSTTATLANSLSLYLGDRDGVDNGDEWSGDLDEVKIYRFALTQEEVRTEYNRGSSMVMGALGSNSSYASNASNQEYCIPGDSSTCTAPVAEWNFEEGKGGSVNDSSGNGNTGTWNGTGSHWTSGKVGKGGNFNGSDDYVEKTDGTGSVLDITGAITLETWIKIDPLEPRTFTECIVGKGNRNRSSTSDGPYQICWNNVSQLEFEIGNSSGADYTSFGNPSNNVWHHLAGVFDGTNLITYLDGKVVNSKVSGISSIKADNSSFLFNRNAYDSQTYKGLIDQVRIFNYARTPAQVAWDYNQGEPVGYWDMDECQGVTIHDRSVNKNNGTLTIGASGEDTVGTCNTSSTAWGSGASGKRNASLSFDGTDDYISVGDSANLDISSTITLMAWVKTGTTNDNDGIIYKGPFNGAHGAYQLLISNGNVFFDLNSSDHRRNTTNAPLSANTWYHLTATYDGSTMKIYINGQANSTTCTIGNCTPASIDTNANSLIIGAYHSSSYTYNGQIDEVKIFNYALTGTQVKELYNGGAVKFGN